MKRRARERVRESEGRSPSDKEVGDETEAKPASASQTRGSCGRRPGRRPEGTSARSGAAEARYAARPLHGTVAVRESDTLRARFENPGNGIELHAASGVGWHPDAFGASLRAPSFGRPDDRSLKASAHHSWHG